MSRLKPLTEEYYHIYNRGVDKRKIFMDEKDYYRFLKSVRGFNEIQSRESEIGSRYVEFICYCLNPNHFHFLLK